MSTKPGKKETTTTLILPLASLKMGRIFRGGKVCIKRCVWNRPRLLLMRNVAVNLYDLTTFAKEILEEGRSIMRQVTIETNNC